jgi:hypothetical protein
LLGLMGSFSAGDQSVETIRGDLRRDHRGGPPEIHWRHHHRLGVGHSALTQPRRLKLLFTLAWIIPSVRSRSKSANRTWAADGPPDWPPGALLPDAGDRDCCGKRIPEAPRPDWMLTVIAGLPWHSFAPVPLASWLPATQYSGRPCACHRPRLVCLWVPGSVP